MIKRASTWIQARICHFYETYMRIHVPVSDVKIQYNGIDVRPYRVTDPYIPIQLSPNQGGHKFPEEYEAALVENLQKNVSLGDKVTIIGGGLGVTAVVAGRAAGSEGEVTIYEGAGNMITHLKETLTLNNVPAQVNIIHAIVADAKRLDGASMGAPTVSVSSLEPCDVLELDCEGAETDILQSLSIRPETIVVETHGNKECVTKLISNLDYEIQNSELAERGPYEEICKNNEIEVLTAQQTY